MEESQSLEKLPKVVTGILKIVLSSALIALAVVLIIALAKITYSLAMMVLNTSSVVPYDVAEQAVMFFLYFGFIGLIAPHVARILLKKRPSQLYLTSALLGALLLLIADLCVQHVPFFSHIYIGTLTAIIGAPCLIWILLTEQRKLAG